MRDCVWRSVSLQRKLNRGESVQDHTEKRVTVKKMTVPLHRRRIADSAKSLSNETVSRNVNINTNIKNLKNNIKY